MLYTITLVTCQSGANKEVYTNKLAPDTCFINVYKNKIYHGISIPISINYPSTSSKNYQLTTNKGQLTKIENNRFYFSLQSSLHQNTVCFQVVRFTNSKKETLCTLYHPTAALPKPIAFLGKKSNLQINKTYLLAQRGIYARLDTSVTNHFNIQYKITILSFDFILNIEDKVVTLSSGDDRFTNQQKNLMTKLNNGDHITIQNISAKNPDGKVWTLEPLTFTIIEDLRN